MTKHIRYILHGLYEIFLLLLVAGIAIGIICSIIWLMAAGYWIPIAIAVLIGVSWFWGYLKESYNE